MAEKRVQRRLAAILVADVVGYSRLMEEDEAATMAALADRRKAVWEPLLATYRGRVIRTKGDSTLAEFASAVDAVQCAVDVQKAMKESNTRMSDGRAIILRIGLNLGDVVVEDGDLYGDGVNVAARLETMADPGAICLSAAIHQQVERLLPFTFEDLGDQALKNIARPVRVYSISGDDRGAGDLPRTGSPASRASPKPSRPAVAVLPFTNMSGDREQQYFGDGITEDIITELSRFRELFVIARHSSFQYRDRSTDVQRIGRELGAQFVVEGSVRKAGQRLLVTAHLIDAATGNHLWAERYDRFLEDIFAVQEEVTRTIVATVAGRLETTVTEWAKRRSIGNPAAYDFLLRGREALMATYFDLSLYTQDAVGSARELLRRAIEIDPGFAQAYANLAQSYLIDWWYLGRLEDIALAVDSAQTAVRLDPDDSNSRDLLGVAHLYRRNYDEARVQLERSIAINPNNASAAHHMALYFDYTGNHTNAIDWEKRAISLNPYHPGFYREHLGYALYSAGRYDEAASALRGLDRLPYWTHAYLAACYVRLNRLDDARAEADEFLNALAADHKGNAKIDREGGLRSLVAEINTYKNQADRDRWLEAIREAGVPI